ncbi:dihydrodipicolinate synthase family protein [Virgibacillus sp. W0181]|uniref:dihydrodipicolinate synthase family protein n=1 Tax=Virgibacillus sp. W0181 TaxID=3391581 RepID=UPI003F45CE6A
MDKTIPNGVWPTMITPFKDDGMIDYNSLENLIEWYIDNGVHGLFAVCQSSEIFHMSLKERIELASFVTEKVAGRIPVIASGNVSFALDDQIEEVKAIADTGVDAVVLLTNKLARSDESDEVFKANVETLLSETEGITLGFYECPLPYKRLLSPELLQWCASTGRFSFLKDTSCDIKQIEEKLERVKNSSLKIFNANAPTLLDSLKLGANGYSGIMCNFHSDLYVHLYENWEKDPEEAINLQSFLGLASTIERQLYPMNSKYFLKLDGILDDYTCRNTDKSQFYGALQLEIKQMHKVSKQYSNKYKNN